MAKSLIVTGLVFLMFVAILIWLPEQKAYAPITPGQVPLMKAVTGTKSIAGGDDPTVEFTIYEDAQTSNRTVGDFTCDLQKATVGFDAVATAADTLTIRIYEQIDGTNYKQLDNPIYTAGSITNNVEVRNFMSPGRKVKFTGQASADRGAFDLPFAFSFRNEN